MDAADSIANTQRFSSLARSRPVVVSALKVALVVGTILALINHGEKILAFSFSGRDMFKVLLTYFVPYAVSTWSAVKALQCHTGPL